MKLQQSEEREREGEKKENFPNIGSLGLQYLIRPCISYRIAMRKSQHEATLNLPHVPLSSVQPLPVASGKAEARRLYLM